MGIEDASVNERGSWIGDLLGSGPVFRLCWPDARQGFLLARHSYFQLPPSTLPSLESRTSSSNAPRREDVTPHWIPWSLIAGGVLSIPIGFFDVTYLPHRILLTAMALALIGLQAANNGDRHRGTTEP